MILLIPVLGSPSPCLTKIYMAIAPLFGSWLGMAKLGGKEGMPPSFSDFINVPGLQLLE